MARPRLRPDVYKIHEEKGIQVSVSTNTIDEFPKVVFMRTKARLTPIEYSESYVKQMAGFKKAFEKECVKVVKNEKVFDKNFIFNITFSEKNVFFKKISHLRYDLFVKPREKSTLMENKEILSGLSESFIDILKRLAEKYGLTFG